MRKSLVLINDQIFNSEDAKISIFDRGFLFGDSIYEVTISIKRKLLFLDKHLDRLFNSARLIDLELQFSKEEIISNIEKLLKNFDCDNSYIRIIITRGIDEISLAPALNLKQNIIMVAKDAPVYEETLYTKGIYLKLVERVRNDIRALDPNAKSGNYLNNILAIKEAKANNAYDAIMENMNGEITEGTTFNIWYIKDGSVYTPHAKSGLLEGITRAKVIEFAALQGVKVIERKCLKEDFFNADEVFITSSTKGIMPVYQLNSTVYHETLAENSMTKKLMNIYHQGVTLHLNETPYTY